MWSLNSSNTDKTSCLIPCLNLGGASHEYHTPYVAILQSQSLPAAVQAQPLNRRRGESMSMTATATTVQTR
uniref:Uncharacterized protein n=1 Tax=Arundo donax TaxID=35708 RepID=A0A0A8ZKS6_ARUDO